MKQFLLLCIALFLITGCNSSDSFDLIKNNAGTKLYYAGNESVVQIAVDMLVGDSKLVCETPIIQVDDVETGSILVGIPDREPEFKALLDHYKVDYKDVSGKWEAYKMTVAKEEDGNRYLLVIGSDPRGAAYGVLELSRKMGVTPWVWWADVNPDKKKHVCVVADNKVHEPKVQYRGIFLNDEDWGLMPWSNTNYEPTGIKGTIGPRTNSRIFELLLRLRANTLWPAMHECTVPFFLTEGNREAAARYNIYMGSSHCEPMACNAVGEWWRRGEGDYNYITNQSSVYKFWEDRVRDVADQQIVYTIGMRGVHDSRMVGVNTQEEQIAALERVFANQRGLLEKYIDADLTEIPQVFVPYKEVLNVYRAGLKVPEDVTLMWCDDNYGFITHYPTEEELARSGGHGMYYHISYWGGPHDYLWLSTMSPGLIYQQMKTAYDRGIRKIWIVNVGDIKPAEYQTELFLDMAWDIDEVTATGVNEHLKQWLEEQFGRSGTKELFPVMQEHYRLAHIRKPEFMGNNRVYERNKPEFNRINDWPWSEQEVNDRISAYEKLSTAVEKAAAKISDDKQSAYYQLVKYPVQAATEMNKKFLYAQLARHGKAEWVTSDAAYDRIVALTKEYNALENGKWEGMMDFQPRKLLTFERVAQTEAITPFVEHLAPTYKWNGTECSEGSPVAYELLGYENRAAGISRGETLTYSFRKWDADTVKVDLRFLPTHPVVGNQLRISVSLDGSTSQEVSYQTSYYSEEWKQNMLRNQAVRTLAFPVEDKGSHKLEIKALDEGVVIDQVLLWKDKLGTNYNY